MLIKIYFENFFYLESEIPLLKNFMFACYFDSFLLQIDIYLYQNL